MKVYKRKVTDNRVPKKWDHILKLSLCKMNKDLSTFLKVLKLIL